MGENELRALTVRQPHAAAIAARQKDVENRTWRFPLPLGTTVALHAGTKLDPGGLDVPGLDVGDDLVFGAIIALMDVVDLVTDSQSAWALPGNYHWVLGNVRRLPASVPCPGRLSLWKVPENLRGQVLSGA